MKTMKTLTVTLAAVALLFGTTACTGNTEAEDKQEIVTLVNDFYGYAASQENASPLVSAVNRIPDGTSDEVALKQVMDAAPEGFKFFDTSTTEKGKEAYTFLGNNHAMLIIDGKTMRIDEAAVTVNDDDTAVVDQSKAYVTDTETGREELNDIPEGTYDSYKTIKLTKVEDEWLITPTETFMPNE